MINIQFIETQALKGELIFSLENWSWGIEVGNSHNFVRSLSL